MSRASREARLVSVFATLADTLVADYDVVDLLQTLVDSCAELLGAQDAAILLADGTGALDLMASTSESAGFVEVMRHAAEAGPGMESFSTGTRVSLPDLRNSPEAWRGFRDSASRRGVQAAEAIPLRLRERTIGSLTLLRSTPGTPAPEDVTAARALADVATIGILQERALRESDRLAAQLQTALDSRVVIEQAKGVVSFTAGVSIDDAFSLIRSHARQERMRLGETAARIVRREVRIGPPR